MAAIAGPNNTPSAPFMLVMDASACAKLAAIPSTLDRSTPSASFKTAFTMPCFFSWSVSCAVVLPIDAA